MQIATWQWIIHKMWIYTLMILARCFLEVDFFLLRKTEDAWRASISSTYTTFVKNTSSTISVWECLPSVRSAEATSGDIPISSGVARVGPSGPRPYQTNRYATPLNHFMRARACIMASTLLLPCSHCLGPTTPNRLATPLGNSTFHYKIASKYVHTGNHTL